MRLLLLLSVLVLLVLADDAKGAAQASDSARYLVIFIDGVSSELFMDELQAGTLENLREAFGPAGIIPHGVTFFPPFTSTVISRMHADQGSENQQILDWSGYDRESQREAGKLRTFLRYIGLIPRRGRSTALYGLPYTGPLAGLALWNLPRLVERYGTVEFYWFGTDTAGHLWGEEALRESLRRPDRYIPRVLDSLPPDVNVMMYADHGMTFGETVNYDVDITELLGPAVEHFAYPNL